MYRQSQLSSFSTAISSPVKLPLSTLGLQILTTHTTQEENDDRSFLPLAQHYVHTYPPTDSQLIGDRCRPRPPLPPPFEFTLLMLCSTSQISFGHHITRWM